MNVNNNRSNVSFQAKFVESDSLHEIVKHSIEVGKFEKLNEARINIGKTYLRAKLKVDIFYSDKKPVLAITKYEPKPYRSGLFMDEYEPTNRVEFECQKIHANPLAYALKILIKMGNNAPDNHIFRAVVAKKDRKSVRDIF